MPVTTGFRGKLVSLFKNKEIRDKIFFSLFILLVFRIMAAVPVPGFPLDALKDLFGGNRFGEVLSMVSGGVLENATLVAIGLGPYINASIIFQLLGSIVPKIEELQKEGAQGRKVISMYTRLLTVPLAILQSFVIYSLLRRPDINIIPEPLATLDLANLVLSLTAGAVIMMWMGELITEMGLGNGTSFLISAGILASIPGSLKASVALLNSTEVMLLVIAAFILIFVVVFFTQAERHIPIQYARRVRSVGAAAESHIPIKLNQSGVMPVIFAISLLSFPQLMAQFFTGPNMPALLNNAALWMMKVFEDQWIHNGVLFIMIVGFSFFYTFVVFNPANVSENLQKQAAFVPGVRPGGQTEKYLRTSALRLAILGSIFLAVVAILPSIASDVGIISSAVISGTGLLIVVGTSLDMKRQAESMVVTRSYESYL